MSQRMRKKRNFDTRMDALSHLLLAKGAGGILNMKEAAENYRNLIDFKYLSDKTTLDQWLYFSIGNEYSGTYGAIFI